jgi:predicted DNA-binding transcriptional regulator YafY
MPDTTARVLHLIGLLQSRSLWTAEELAERLGVTTRSVRRDVERLRELGYPVKASRGAGGGYQLGPGRALPPLLLDPEEAVAVAVCLRLAAGGSVAGVDEAAVRALAKLDQVLPPRLRAHVTAVQESTVAIERLGAGVDPDTLLTLARACRDREVVGFDYTDRAGTPSQRRAEPYRLVSLGRRWYLLAFDTDKDDWRSFRLDRMSTVSGRAWRFQPREAPDAAEFVEHSVTQAPYRAVATVHVGMPAEELSERVPPTAGTVRRLDEQTSELVTGQDDLRWLAVHLALLEAPVTVVDPPELRGVMAELGQALLRASASTAPSASTT